jgi:hypothetical protein
MDLLESLPKGTRPVLPEDLNGPARKNGTSVFRKALGTRSKSHAIKIVSLKRGLIKDCSWRYARSYCIVLHKENQGRTTSFESLMGVVEIRDTC